jgi:hypothetical protein
MLEINEAANIITESIDPNAKVIFGAVVDEALKKGEVQITVVATGFDEEKVRETTVEKLSRLSLEESRKVEQPAPEMKVTFPEKFESKMIIEEKVPPKPKKNIAIHNKDRDLVDDEDDELEIPAFIRRKMGK